MNNLCLRRYILSLGRDLSANSLKNLARARWRKWWLMVAVFVGFSCLSGTLRAEELEETSHWFGLIGNWRIDKDLDAIFQVQPRFSLNEMQRENNGVVRQLIGTAALGYRLTDKLKFYQGYGSLANYRPKRFEHRLFQDVVFSQKFTNFALTTRSRIEERLLEKNDRISLRGRQLIRLLKPITDDYGLVLSNDVLMHLNDLEGNFQRGFDQNRMFLGINMALAPYLNLETGYQNVYVERRGASPDSVNHTAVFSLITKFGE